MSDDFIREERKWAREEQDREDRRRERANRERTERIGYICITVSVITVASIIGALVWLISNSATENGTKRQAEHEKTITACTQSGRSWVSINGGEYTCLDIGKGPS